MDRYDFLVGIIVENMYDKFAGCYKLQVLVSCTSPKKRKRKRKEK